MGPLLGVPPGELEEVDGERGLGIPEAVNAWVGGLADGWTDHANCVPL